jgi:hypothetical protein
VKQYDFLFERIQSLEKRIAVIECNQLTRFDSGLEAGALLAATIIGKPYEEAQAIANRLLDNRRKRPKEEEQS